MKILKMKYIDTVILIVFVATGSSTVVYTEGNIFLIFELKTDL